MADITPRYGIEDPSPNRCQCIMDHLTKRDGDIWQCRELRDPSSNLFCANCEKLHGDFWRERHAREEAEKRSATK